MFLESCGSGRVHAFLSIGVSLQHQAIGPTVNEDTFWVSCTLCRSRSFICFEVFHAVYIVVEEMLDANRDHRFHAARLLLVCFLCQSASAFFDFVHV